MECFSCVEAEKYTLIKIESFYQPEEKETKQKHPFWTSNSLKSADYIYLYNFVTFISEMCCSIVFVPFNIWWDFAPSVEKKKKKKRNSVGIAERKEMKIRIRNS